MRALLQRLLIASQWGASLVLVAGCGSTVESGSGGNGGSSGTTSSTSGTTTPPSLDPQPETTCAGPVYNDGFGYHGQCCEEVVCVAPSGGACPSSDAPTAEMTQHPNYPKGSGTCGCELPLRGPFANEDPAAAEACCYLVGVIGCDGRPLMVDGAPRLAPVLAGPSGWSHDGRTELASAIAAMDLSALPEATRAALADRWTKRGRFEHASVASFSRFALSLMAVGAPPALVEAAHHAALDEVEHARLCLSLASAYAGRPLAYGTLPIGGAFGDIESLEAAAVGTVIEGCVGETLAALEAAETAALAGPEAVKRALSVIAEDETRHAELGWAFVRWALAKGGPSLRKQVVAAFDRAMREVVAVAPGGDQAPSEHGFLPAADVARLRRQAVAEVIRPATQALLAMTAPEAVATV